MSNKPVMTTQELGKIIRNYRKEQHLTLLQAAALCDVGVRFLRELEIGKETASLGKTLQVVNSLGLSITICPKSPFRSQN